MMNGSEENISRCSIIRSDGVKYWVAVLSIALTLLPATAQNVWPQVPEKPVRVACLGNSVTYGLGIPDRDKFSYPAQLQKMLGKEYVVGNFGKSGATLLRKAFRPYDKTEEFAAVFDFQPDMAVIHLGLNDTDPRAWPDYRDDFISDYLWLIDTLKKTGTKKIYVAKMSPIFSGHKRFKAGTRVWYDEIQKEIEQVAEISGATLIDFNAPLNSRPDLVPDNVHPDAEGAGLLAGAVYSSITGDCGGLSLPWGWSDNMVIQQGKPVRLAGRTNRGEKVVVSIAGKEYVTYGAVNGDWHVVIDPLKPGGPFDLNISSSGRQIKIANILAGEVWFCSGQSNMYFPVRSSDGARAVIDTASDNYLRLIRFDHMNVSWNVPWDSVALEEVNKLDFFKERQWEPSSGKSVADFSAVAYFFGSYIRRQTGMPVGIIEMAVGGSPAQAWISRHSLEENPVTVDLFADYRNSEYADPWVREAMQANLSYAVNPRQRHPFEPAYLYEAGISHLAGFPVRGFLWYQGESNANFPELHETLLPLLVTTWREAWGDAGLPFYYAQLSGIDRPSWPFFRDSQRRLQDVIPGSAMIVTSDVGNATDVHPRDKLTVGKRFALLALGDTYGRDIICKSPEPEKAEYHGSQLVISFRNARLLKTSDSQELREIEVSCTGDYFIPAKAVIKRNKLIIDNEGLKAVRYGWKPFSQGNLVNEGNLPASTFTIEVMNKK